MSSRKQVARRRASNAAESNTAWGSTDAKQMDGTADTAADNNNWGGASADNTGWGDTSADNGTWGNTGASAWGTTGTSGWGAGVPQPPEPPKAKETNAFSFGPPPPPPNNGTRSRTASTSGASSVTIAVRWSKLTICSGLNRGRTGAAICIWRCNTPPVGQSRRGGCTDLWAIRIAA